MAGIIYITSMNRPDAAMALVMLYALQRKQEAHIGSICVEGSGLGAATFCDILYRFYHTGALKDSNTLFPIGLNASVPLPADPPMVRTALTASYVRGIRKVCDTSLAEAVIRNGVTLNAESIMILSAPATSLARSLDLNGAKTLYKERVKTLIVVDPQDSPAMQHVMDEFPSPVVICGKEIGESVLYPATGVPSERRHPLYDAYTAFQPMPFDAPTHDMAAMLYAVRPTGGFFQVSGNRLKLDPVQKDKLLETYIQLASAKPAVPVNRPTTSPA